MSCGSKNFGIAVVAVVAVVLQVIVETDMKHAEVLFVRSAFEAVECFLCG